MASIRNSYSTSRAAGGRGSGSAAAAGGAPAAASQFEAWAREKAALQAAAAAADERRAALERQVAAQREQQKDLLERTRAAQTAAGRVQMEAAALERRREQLRRQLAQERRDLEAAAAEAERLAAVDRAEKRAFCTTMQAANAEWAALLTEQDELRLQHMISMETVGLLVDAQRAAAPASVPFEIPVEFEEAVAALKASTEEHRKAKDLHKSHQQLVVTLREQAKQVSIGTDATGAPKFPNDEFLNQLESTWMAQQLDAGADADGSATANPSVQMDLFYGNGEAQSQESIAAE